MPEISRFLGIIIYMYFNEHDPAHFYVKYNNYRAKISISDFSLMDGNLPPRVFGLVIEWAEIYQKELLKNWSKIKKTGDFNKIAPLVK